MVKALVVVRRAVKLEVGLWSTVRQRKTLERERKGGKICTLTTTGGVLLSSVKNTAYSRLQLVGVASWRLSNGSQVKLGCS